MRGTQFAQLTAFAAVAEHQSFARAAEDLQMSAPWLSQTIRLLEEQFGVRLLNRTTRSVALTQAGEELLAHLTSAIEAVDQGVEAVLASKGRAAGLLRLSVHPIAAATVIAPLLPEFSAAFPEIRLAISVDSEPGDLVGQRFDVGVHPRRLVAQHMIGVHVASQSHLATVAAPSYLDRRPAPTVPEDLETHDCIVGHWEERPGYWRFAKGNQQVDVAVQGTIGVNDFALAIHVVSRGLGVAQLPCACVAPMLERGSLVELLTTWEVVQPEFLLFHPSRRLMPTTLSTLVEFVRLRAKGRTSADPSPEKRMRHPTQSPCAVERAAAFRRPPARVFDGMNGGGSADWSGSVRP